MTIDSIYKVISNGLEDALSRLHVLKRYLSAVEGIEVVGVRVRVRDRKPSILYEVFKAVNDASPERGGFIVAIDEAQYLALIRGFTKILAHVYDYMDNIKVILTGSEVGLLDRLLGRKNPDAPLYGRPILEIQMKRLSREDSIRFLEQGFNELNIDWSKSHIEDAVNKLDGIPGWLTYYGYHAYITRSHSEALAKNNRSRKQYSCQRVGGVPSI